MMLNEMGGMRVQATSPSLGAASVRIQGMKGRYTTFLSDGLPLFGEVGGLGLLQIPPMDLRQVEVIKGVASSMYGAGAMGGVVNLLSRRPGEETERELMLNRSTRGGTDAIGWFSTPARKGWAMTLLAGGHFQERTDVDGDAWADLPHYSRAVVRPRVFWDGGDGRSFFATAGFTGEDRRGGGQPAGSTSFEESLTTRRFDVGAVGQTLLSGRHVVTARGAYMQQRHGHRFGEVSERDRHEALFGEVTVRTSAGRHLLVGGLAVERDTYRALDLPQFSYTFTAPGIFVQDDVALANWLSVSASARFDHHSEYGNFVSPRIAALVRSGSWSSRLSAGTGFYGPSPLTEDPAAAGLSRGMSMP
jgi:iron complex outermembrane receptor protein